jgi:hypothetical protein
MKPQPLFQSDTYNLYFVIKNKTKALQKNILITVHGSHKVLHESTTYKLKPKHNAKVSTCEPAIKLPAAPAE